VEKAISQTKDWNQDLVNGVYSKNIDTRLKCVNNAKNIVTKEKVQLPQKER